MFDGWNWQACTEMIMTSYGVSSTSIFPPEPFNFTEVVAGCRASTGLPPRPYWLEAEFGGCVSFYLASVCGRDILHLYWVGLSLIGPGYIFVSSNWADEGQVWAENGLVLLLTVFNFVFLSYKNLLCFRIQGMF